MLKKMKQRLGRLGIQNPGLSGSRARLLCQVASRLGLGLASEALLRMNCCLTQGPESWDLQSELMKALCVCGVVMLLVLHQIAPLSLALDGKMHIK